MCSDSNTASIPGEDEFFDRYLHLLEVRRRKPDGDSLKEIVKAHLFRVPYENVSKLYYKKCMGLVGLPSLQQFLNGIKLYSFGGTCYANNFYLNRLLSHLGYEVALCGADLSKPDVHIVSIVRVGGREYLVDVGYAAPFLEPLPRDLAREHVITLGNDRYVLKPQDNNGCSRLEMYSGGVLKHGYTVKPGPRRIEEFNQAIADSYRADATFLNALLLVRFSSGRSDVIHNMTYIESVGAKTTMHALTSRDDVVQVMERVFFIPGRMVIEVLDEIGQMKEA
jgi:arylamine N-acetyltransferase